jgi:hypothetical protein
MKQVLFIVVASLLSSFNLAIACSCGSSGDFLTVSPKTDLVALIKVTKYLTYRPIYDKKTPMSMEVEIVRTFKGLEKRKTVTVWGDNGILCRPYLSRFDTGKYYVIAFFKGADGTKGLVHAEERPTDYTISICGDYWLSADNNKNIATGPVSSNLTAIGFGELWSFFNGDKTKELKPKDFQEIYQLALDLPILQKYYHVERDSIQKQVVIKYFGEADHNNLTGVVKFGKQIRILSGEEIAKQKIANYFVLGDWVCGQQAVRMQLSYVGEGLTISYMFKKKDEHWEIISSQLWEE